MSSRLASLAAILAVLAVPAYLNPFTELPCEVNRWRYVHAARARKLRRRGEDVRFHCNSPHGRAVYKWRPAHAWEAV